MTRRPRDRDCADRGSLVMAMLLTLVGITLSGLLVPVVVTQIAATRTDMRRNQALNAAQAGIDVALGHLRAARDLSGAGVLATLPCTPAGSPLAGRVDGTGTTTYQVTIDYFVVDPQGKPDTWVASNAMSCLAGFGTPVTPAFALFRSTGTDQAAGGASVSRSLRASYIFQTTNENIAGGLVHVYKTAASTDMCMDAGTTTPVPGGNLQMQPCSPGSNQQKFAYNTNLTLGLVASPRTVAQPLGMCLDAGTPHTAGSLVKFQPCSVTTKPQQQWSINDSANFEGTTDGKTLDNFCFNVQSPNTPGSLVVLATTGASKCKQGYDNIETYSPDPAVGAGAAGESAGQLVNFSQFGRCIDVTEQNVNKGFLITWPCKQAPDPKNVLWNQKWLLPTIPAKASSASGPITTTPSVVYCMRSPLSTAPYQYVTVTPCPALPTPTNMTWTVWADTGTYATSFRVTDSSGFCLAPTDPNATPPDLYPNGLRISKLVVAVCTGATAQKWNAPPNILQPLPLKDIGEK